MALRLGAIVQALGGELHGSPELMVHALAPLESATANDLSFLSHLKYINQLASSQAGCVIVSPQFQRVALERGACIVADQPYLYYARLTQLWKQHSSEPDRQHIHPTAVVDVGARVDPQAWIGPLCVVERGARIGAHTVLKSRVTLGENCVVGERCILHSGVVIGADGFGFAPRLEQGGWEKIEQLGAVQIGNDVEIGANSCVDRGALQDTVLEDGVKIDNLVQIGHNVRIGQHSALAGCVGIAGSAVIGAHCTVGGGAVVLGHLQLADHVNISAASVVTRSILKSGHYTGLFPIDDNAVWEKNAATLKQIHSLRDRIRDLEKIMKSGNKP